VPSAPSLLFNKKEFFSTNLVYFLSLQAGKYAEDHPYSKYFDELMAIRRNRIQEGCALYAKSISGIGSFPAVAKDAKKGRLFSVIFALTDSITRQPPKLLSASL
jgi:hypothetical protein